MDIVYPYRSAAGDFELRYSLRSLANAEHSRVIVSGDKPEIPGVFHVPVKRYGNRYQSSTENILAAARIASDRFMVMHDDIFLLRPFLFRHEDRGSIADYLASGEPKGTYRGQVKATQDLLKSCGVSDPLFFGLHTPTIYERDKLINVINEFRGRAYLLRTLYHNLHPQPSVTRSDVKLFKWSPDAGSKDILSTSDRLAALPEFRRFIQERFPEPSPYEG